MPTKPCQQRPWLSNTCQVGKNKEIIWNETEPARNPSSRSEGPSHSWIHIAAGKRLWAAVCQVLSGRDRSKTTSATSASCKSAILRTMSNVVSNYVISSVFWCLPCKTASTRPFWCTLGTRATALLLNQVSRALNWYHTACFSIPTQAQTLKCLWKPGKTGQKQNIKFNSLDAGRSITK